MDLQRSDIRKAGLASRLFELYASDLMRSARRYLVAGGLSAIADWALFALFLYQFGLAPVAAGALSFVLATVLNYLLSVHIVFGASPRGARTALTLVFAVSAVGMAINLTVLSVAVDFLGLHPMFAKISASGAALLWNFATRYFYIFR